MSVEAEVSAAEFDSLIDEALDCRYSGILREDHHLGRLRVTDLLTAYRSGGVYPTNRIPEVTSRAIDFKLQMYLTGEIVPGLINLHYYGPVRLLEGHNVPAHLRLVRESLDQDLILKSRILWERLMHLVYFIEQGRPISGKSTKRQFFKMCHETPRWYWFNAFAPRIENFDDRFRTPEVHKASTLRRRLMGDASHIDSNDLLGPLNDAMNAVWDNLTSIVGGGSVVALTLAHSVDQDGEALPDGGAFDYWGWEPSTDHQP